jgi:TIR domain
MKLFICWAGERSQEIAVFLRSWLPTVHQNIDPFVSEEDIGSGVRWRDSLSISLESTDSGVVCLTSDNLRAPWLHFEAGDLSKLPKYRIVPILYNIAVTDVQGPLQDFQAVIFGNKDGMRRLLRSINEAMNVHESTNNWERSFDKFWEDVEELQYSLQQKDRIEIISPIDGDNLEGAAASGTGAYTYRVQGRLKHLSKDHVIWLLNSNERDEYWLQEKVIYNPATYMWEGRAYLQRQYRGTYINAVVAPPTSQQFFLYYITYGKPTPLSGIPNECVNAARVWASNPLYSPS